MINFDYYQIRGKWNAATLNRRAEKLEEAQTAADELERAGAKSVEIIGVKAGKRETIRGKKAATKDAKKKATKPKASANKKTPVKRANKPNDRISNMSADDLSVIDSIFSRDGKVKILKTDTPKKEPPPQLDLFNDDDNKEVVLKFNEGELKTLINDYLDLLSGGERLVNYKSILTTFEKAAPRQKIQFTKKEIASIIGVLQRYLRKHIKEKGVTSNYKHTKELREFLIRAYYNV